jgi:hypothetical protein
VTVATADTVRYTGSSARSAVTDQRPSSATSGICASPVNASSTSEPSQPSAVISAPPASAQAAGRGANRVASRGASAARTTVTRKGT